MEGKYYVYLHQNKKTKEIVYCGKGSGYRFCGWSSRKEEHSEMLRRREIDFLILKYFNDEIEAYAYEEKVTAFFKSVNLCKFNISIGRRTSNETKRKLSKVLKGKSRNKETREKIKLNHARPLARTVRMYKDNILIKEFNSSRDAGNYAVNNKICSYGWCGRSLKTGEETKPTRYFPNGGYRFVYNDDKIQYKEDR